MLGFLNISANKAKSVLIGFLLVTLVIAAAGCGKTAKTSEPPSNADVSYDCNVSQGFNLEKSSTGDTDAIKQQIADVQTQIQDLQDKIKSRQGDLAALKNAADNSQITALEKQIKDLQEQIASLQSRLKELQAAAQTEETTNLEKEIEGMQAQLSSLQGNLSALQDQLKNPVSVEDQGRIGHIDYLKIGDTELAADFSVADPMSPGQSKGIVGVVPTISWAGGYAEPIQFTCQVSGANKNKIAAMMNKTLANASVELAFSIYEYDPKTKSYYKCFHTKSDQLDGLVLKQGGEVAMNIEDSPSTEVVSPRNYTFSLGVMPQEKQMEVYLAVSSTDKFTKQWGVKVGD